MNEKCGHYLDYGQDAYLEHNLFYKEGIRKKSSCPRAPGIGKEKPGHYAHYEPAYKGIILRLRDRSPSAHSKYKPVDQHRDRRLQKHPYDPHIRARILRSEVVDRKLPYELAVIPQLLGQYDYPVIQSCKYSKCRPQHENGDYLLDDLLFGYRKRIMMKYNIACPDRAQYCDRAYHFSLCYHFIPRDALYSANPGHPLSLSFILSSPSISGQSTPISLSS